MKGNNMHRMLNFDGKPMMARLSDGTLLAFFFGSHEHADAHTARYAGHRVTMRTSSDHGATWGEQRTVLTLPTDRGGFFRPDGLVALVDDVDEVHLFFLNDADTGVVPTLAKFVDVPGEGERPKQGTTTGRRLDIWHMRTTAGRTRWPQPRPIWTGYCGALNSVVQLRSGRIVLPFAFLTDRTWGGRRGEGVEMFTFHGQYDCTVLYSDDHGATWRLSSGALRVPVPDIVSAYGAVEPVVHQLRDGRMWMLIRTQLGRFYESFSDDGDVWSTPAPTRLGASDSPAAVVGLSDGRIVLFWNNAQRFPYAYGGRHILHAAISDDDGRTWCGYREVARDPKRADPPPPAGDHGTGYPFAVATADDRVILSTGQSADRAHCAIVDPAWLYETDAEADMSPGSEQWATFGTQGVSLAAHPDDGTTYALRLTRPDPVWPAAAVWNFPALLRGMMRIRLRLDAGAVPVRLSLADHFSVPFDQEDELYALFNLPMQRGGKLTAEDGLIADRWHALELAWDCIGARACSVRLDGRMIAQLPLLHVSEAGPCYLRLVATGCGDAAVWVDQVNTFSNAGMY